MKDCWEIRPIIDDIIFVPEESYGLLNSGTFRSEKRVRRGENNGLVHQLVYTGFPSNMRGLQDLNPNDMLLTKIGDSKIGIETPADSRKQQWELIPRFKSEMVRVQLTSLENASSSTIRQDFKTLGPKHLIGN